MLCNLCQKPEKNYKKEKHKNPKKQITSIVCSNCVQLLLLKRTFAIPESREELIQKSKLKIRRSF